MAEKADRYSQACQGLDAQGDFSKTKAGQVCRDCIVTVDFAFVEIT
ncbi:hypothetical protein [Pelagimonas varians]|nr:hypothetical protein [Pelagimonas varians]